MNNCLKCGNSVPVERIELGYRNCVTCSTASYKKPKGVMIWTHKTNPEIQIMSNDCWESQKKYFIPNGPRSAVKNFSKSISK